jgi:tetratricopeptide (TPR) repeat protein
VCGREALRLLSELQEQSLLGTVEGQGEVRYRLLEPLREYAGEKLEERGEISEVQARHAPFFLALAEEPEGNRGSSAWWEWLGRLEREYDNLGAVLDWSLAEERIDEALRLATALAVLWENRGPLREGRRRLAQVLARAPGQTRAWANALQEGGALALLHGDVAAARSFFEQSLAIWQALAHKPEIARLLHSLGDVVGQADWEAARAYYEQGLALRQEVGDRKGSAASLCSLGYIALKQGDRCRARTLFEEAVAIDREFGDRGGDAPVALSGVLSDLGEHTRARALLTESLLAAQERGSMLLVINVLTRLARLALAEATTASHPPAGGTGRGRLLQSVRLFGAAAALRDAMGLAQQPYDAEQQGRDAAVLRATLGEELFTAAWAEGRAMSLEEAIQYAFEELDGE